MEKKSKQQNDGDEMKDTLAAVTADPLELRVARLEDEIARIRKYLNIPESAHG